MNTSHWKIAIYSSCSYLNRPLLGCVDDFADLYIQIAEVLSQGMGYSFETVLENEIGRPLEDDSVSGLLGLVHQSIVDIAVSPITITERRFQYINYSHPFRVHDITFATKMPEPLSKIFAILLPFSLDVWMTTIASVISMMLLYRFFLGERIRCSRIATYVLATALRQSSTIKPSRTSEQVLMSSWMLGMFLLTSCYLSLLLSFMTLPVLTGIRTIPQLAEAISNSECRCMTALGSGLPHLLLRSPSQYDNIIGSSILEHKGFDSIEYFINSDEEIAFVEGREDIEFLQQRFFISKDSFLQSVEAFAIRKGFPQLEKLNVVIQRILASGVFSKIFTDYDLSQELRMFSDRPTGNNVYPRKLSLRDVASAFITLICGMGIAFVVLLIEIKLHEYRCI